MKRRKKKSSEATTTTEAPPLQPAYPEVAEPAAQSETTSTSANSETQQAAETETQKASAPERSRPRRRRKKKSAQSPETRAEQPAETSEPASELAEPETVGAVTVPEPAAEVESIPQEAVADEAAAAPTAAPQVPPVVSVRKGSKGAVVLAVGLPGSGKSTWFKRHGVTPLSSDMVRHLLFDNATEQRYQDLVFGTLRSLLRARLISRMPMNYVDATNLSPKERRHWIRMAKDFGYDVHAVYFDVPMEVCMERNRRRNRVVPDDVMHRMAAKLRPPTFDEGFAKIVVVRVKPRAEGQASDVDATGSEG